MHHSHIYTHIGRLNKNYKDLHTHTHTRKVDIHRTHTHTHTIPVWKKYIHIKTHLPINSNSWQYDQQLKQEIRRQELLQPPHHGEVYCAGEGWRRWRGGRLLSFPFGDRRETGWSEWMLRDGSTRECVCVCVECKLTLLFVALLPNLTDCVWGIQVFLWVV